jgi:membrane protein implicated in regulation of membrane protease activity
MDLVLAPEVRPFAIAALMLAGLTAIEMLTLLSGFSLSHFVEKSLGDHHAEDGGSLSWLNVGGVPLLILLMLVLAFFAATGFIVQMIAGGLFAPLPALVASGIAVVATVPAVRVSTRAIARLVPRDETYAVELGDLVGLTAEVTVGPVDSGLPGRVRVKDRHGNWHVLRARAAPGAPAMPVGTVVLLVDRKAGTFLAIPAPSELRDGVTNGGSV